MGSNEGRPTRRATRRAETLAEIHELALRQLAESGPAGLNLRAIARDMGMSSAGIYRYFESRDDLVVSLIAAGFDDLGAAIRAGSDGEGPASDRLAAAFGAYRRWAKEQPQVFALLFTAPIPHFVAPEDGPTSRAVRAAMSPLVMLGAELVGGRAASGDAADADGVPPQFTANLLQLWSSIHGFVSLEVFHLMEWAHVDVDAAFDAQVAASLDVFVRSGAPTRR